MLKVDSVVVGIPSITDEAEAIAIAFEIALSLQDMAKLNSLYCFYDTDERCFCVSLKYQPLERGCKDALELNLERILPDTVYHVSHVHHVAIICQNEVEMA